MINMIKLIIMTSIFALPLWGSTTPDIKITHTPNQIYVGDHITLNILFTRPIKSVILFKEQTIESFDLIKKEVKQNQKGDLIHYHYILTLSTYNVGEQTLPELTFIENDGRQQREFKTAPYPLNILSTLKDSSKETTLNDIKDTLSIHEQNYLLIWVIGSTLGSTLLTLLFVWILRRYQPQKQEIITPPRPAHEIAYERLSKLMANQLVEKGLMKQYHFELSEIIREYLGNRFLFDSVELTTTELKDHLNSKMIFDRTKQPLVDNFLDDTDLVKFARYMPPPTAVEEITTAAFAIIDQTHLNSNGTQKKSGGEYA